MKFFILVLVTLNLLVPFAFAEQNALEKQIIDAVDRFDQNTELVEEQKNQVLTTLKDAQRILIQANEQAELAENYDEIANTASQKILTIQDENTRLKNRAIEIDAKLPVNQLQNQVLLELADQESRLTMLNEKQQEQSDLSVRGSKIANELSEALANKKIISEAINKDASQSTNPIEIADFLKQSANVEKYSATINKLEREIDTIPVRQTLVDAELVQLRMQSEYYEKKITALRDYLSQTRSIEVQATLNQNKETLEQFEPKTPLYTIASENVSLAELLVKMQADSSFNKENISTLRNKKLEVQQSSETVERVLATGRVTDELGELLRKLRTSLPNVGAIDLRKDAIEEAAIRNQLDVILWQERVRNISDSSVTSQQFLEEALQDNKENLVQDQNDSSTVFTYSDIVSAQKLVETRRALLSLLIAASNEKSDGINEEKLLINQLLLSSAELRELLDRRLIWLPSNSGKAGNLANNFINNIQWYLSPDSWLNSIKILYAGILKTPTLFLISLIIPITILALKSKIINVLQSLVNQVGRVGKDTYFTTPLALLLTFILALPVPLVLCTLAGLILNNAESSSFSAAIATGLGLASSVSLILLFFRSMSRQDGIFDKHFGWSDIARNKLRKMLTWFVQAQSLVTFVFASAIASGEPELRYGIAIIAFITGSLFITIFTYQFFQPNNGVANSVEGDSSASTFMYLSFPFIVISPFVIGLLPLFGFFDTAVELQSKLFLSGILLVLVAVVYGIMLRIFLVTFRRHIMKKKRLEAKLQQEELLAQSNNESNPPQTINNEVNNEINNDEVIRQSRTIILWISRLLFIACLWFVWKPLLPALGIVDDIVLWQEVTVVSGVELASDVTLLQIILGISFIAGGVVAAKNIRGVIEIGFFERFKMDNGARYALITLLGYILVGTGSVVGLSLLGIDWSKLQWIVAALGVGLGFGLQEIVANFVSGIIILFERPIRVGDLVTIGDQSGTVTNISIRATTVTDFDNREVLLPNKSIITENVTNWTLNDAVTRVVIKIGVAYGSDVEQVRDLLMQELKNKQDILTQPGPQVFFLEHGDSSLNFEARVYVEKTEHRLPVTHAINSSFNQVLAENNISIPFPQRDLHIVSNQLVP
ncbi:mechanosensitive ion channel domain-containing protein [Psychromonas arctica]|uniref:Mechanosensitive ion channel domain-containing protein n=1 Tax=Psychromonas arctica TaxID=168275 RepID=A0ABU9HA25_9GAMM